MYKFNDYLHDLESNIKKCNPDYTIDKINYDFINVNLGWRRIPLVKYDNDLNIIILSVQKFLLIYNIYFFGFLKTLIIQECGYFPARMIITTTTGKPIEYKYDEKFVIEKSSTIYRLTIIYEAYPKEIKLEKNQILYYQLPIIEDSIYGMEVVDDRVYLYVEDDENMLEINSDDIKIFKNYKGEYYTTINDLKNNKGSRQL